MLVAATVSLVLANELDNCTTPAALVEAAAISWVWPESLTPLVVSPDRLKGVAPGVFVYVTEPIRASGIVPVVRFDASLHPSAARAPDAVDAPVPPPAIPSCVALNSDPSQMLISPFLKTHVS